MSVLLDANAILRHLLDDLPDQANIATEAIESGASVLPEVVAECVYVLAGPYQLDRALISKTLLALLEEVDCERRVIIQKALDIYASSKFDFVDCILVSTNRLTSQPILTFDKKLNRVLSQ